MHRAWAGLVLGIAAGCGPKAETSASAPAGQGVSRSSGDVAADPSSWSSLAADERSRQVRATIDDTNYRSLESVRKAHAYLCARNEATAAGEVLTRRLQADANCTWAHGVRGDVDVAARVSKCLKECELAEAEDLPSVANLRKAAGPCDAGPRWVDRDTATKLDELIAAVRGDEARLNDPHAVGIDKWVRWQQGYPVMKDLAEVHATAGPYLVFVSFDGGKAKQPTRDAENAAKSILDRNLKVLTHLYGRWSKEVAEPLRLAKYDEKSADANTILKADVFTDPRPYLSYQFEADWWSADYGNVAHYVDVEPRFLAAVDAQKLPFPDPEGAIRTEAVRQLVHFHTWDATRKSSGREIEYALCRNRPLWSADGFPLVFGRLVAAPEPAKATRPWLEAVFVGRSVAEARKWNGWTLAEILAMKDRQDLVAAARRRVGGEFADAAIEPMSQLFTGRAASLVDFLWNAQDGGKPKYRERYLAYLGSEMVARTKVDFSGKEVCVRVTPEDFRRALGLTSDDALGAFDKEWSTYEAAEIDSHKSPQWPGLVQKALAQIDAAAKK
jgi:hypothetical protein